LEKEAKELEEQKRRELQMLQQKLEEEESQRKAEEKTKLLEKEKAEMEKVAVKESELHQFQQSKEALTEETAHAPKQVIQPEMQNSGLPTSTAKNTDYETVTSQQESQSSKRARVETEISKSFNSNFVFDDLKNSLDRISQDMSSLAQTSTRNNEQMQTVMNSTNSSGAIQQKENELIQSQLSVMMTKLQSLQMSFEDLKSGCQVTAPSLLTKSKARDFEPQNNETADEKTSVAIRNSKSIDKILQHATNWDYHYENANKRELDRPDGIHCKTCAPQLGTVKQNRFGIANYDFSKGDSFQKCSKQPREFINLKTKVLEHEASKSHNAKIQVEPSSVTYDSHKQRNEKIGMTLGRDAYKAITVNKSQQSYEMEVACDSAKGVDVGQQNHSRMFASEMTGYFYATLRDKFQEKIVVPLQGTGKTSPVSLIADKYTPNRRTLDIVGANMYLDGKMQTLYLNGDVVKDHTGKGIASGLENAANQVYGKIDWKTRHVFVYKRLSVIYKFFPNIYLPFYSFVF